MNRPNWLSPFAMIASAVFSPDIGGDAGDVNHDAPLSRPGDGIATGQIGADGKPVTVPVETVDLFATLKARCEAGRLPTDGKC